MGKRIVVLAFLVLCSCSYPTTVTQSQSKDTLLMFAGVPAGATLVLDDKEIGPIAQYQGKNALSLSPGRHKITVLAGGAIIYTEQAYLPEGGVKTIQLEAK